ncbi:MAG TPA: methyltransferase domain-containing protein [Candidatus Acidoferrum sp.]|jgi:2-polyprenyl-3-methyl-5-hydroxy-6-metoxy-1,4-benzoquinol methylase
MSAFSEPIAAAARPQGPQSLKINGMSHPIACPLCESTDTHRKKLIDLERVVKLWQKMFEIDIRPELHGLSEMELRSCRRCSISFFIPDVLTGSGEMYAQLEKIGYYYPTRRWEYGAAIEDLRGRQKILEIGCGSGHFIDMAKAEAGLSIEGLEQNREAIRTAVEKGLVVHEASVEEIAKDYPRSFDAICSFQVIEHVPRLAEFVNHCCSMLKPGGLFIAAMPNQRSYVRRMVNPLDMPPHHMTRWTRASILQIQNYFPLKLARTAYEPLSDPQIEFYIQVHEDILRRWRLGGWIHPWIRSRMIRVIRRLKLYRLWRGQNMYACYVRD